MDDIAMVTVVVRTTSGQTHKVVFGADGACTSGDASLLAAASAHAKVKKEKSTAPAGDDKKSDKPKSRDSSKPAR